MGENNTRPPFIAWGLYRERIGRTLAMEWRELGPVFTHTDGSGGFGHFKSLPSAGWNNRFTFRRYGEGPPPLPVLRRAAEKPKPPPEDEEPDTLFSGDDVELAEPSEDQG